MTILYVVQSQVSPVACLVELSFCQAGLNQPLPLGKRSPSLFMKSRKQTFLQYGFFSIYSPTSSLQRLDT